MEQILDQFMIEGIPISCGRYGNGHINETYLVVTNRPHLYILQKLNSVVFHDLKGVMDNIIAVTEHLKNKSIGSGQTLCLVPTKEGNHYYIAGDGEYWRLYEFITNSICLEKAQTVNDFRQSAIAFGEFQNQLSDFPAASLVETIPHFHDTPVRFKSFHEAIDLDRVGRVRECREEINSFLSRENEASTLIDLLNKQELPLRVTHNDTKLNNVMLKEHDHTPLCVIDLDTVMPGLVANDFGDSIRFGASTAAEDEKNTDNVALSLDLYRAYAEGFLHACGSRLTKKEIDTLPIGAKLMTLECGVRFLTDYLNGDTYFHINYPEHNLVRCRTQIKLVEETERAWNSILTIFH